MDFSKSNGNALLYPCIKIKNKVSAPKILEICSLPHLTKRKFLHMFDASQDFQYFDDSLRQSVPFQALISPEFIANRCQYI